MTREQMIQKHKEDEALFWFTVGAGFGAEGARRKDTDEKIKEMIPTAISLIKKQLGI